MSRLCLGAGLLGALNIAIHLAYGMENSIMVVTVLVLAVTQALGFTIVIAVRTTAGRTNRSQESRTAPHDPSLLHLSKLEFTDKKPSQNQMPSTLASWPSLLAQEQHVVDLTAYDGRPG